MNIFKFKTDLTVGDYKSLCRLQAKAALCIVSLAGGIFIGLMLTRLLNYSVALSVLSGIAGCALVYLAVSFYIAWRANKIYNMSTVSEVLELTLNDKGITQISCKGELDVEWQDIYKVVEDKKCYFVFINRNKAFYFPKRNFTSAENEQQFVDFLVEKVHPARIKFKR